MQVLSSRLDLDDFFERIPRVKERVLMLDYDGTLAPFQVWPERAVPYPGVVEAMKELMEDGGTRVVIVSGRRAEDLVPLLALETRPEIWGGHGWERLLPSGELKTQDPSAADKLALEEALQSVQELERGGARIERKPASLALHWRGLPALAVAEIQEQAHAAWARLVRGGLEMLSFDGGLELRVKGSNKQHAVKAVLSETAEDSAVAYLGDDITDEDAFATVKARGIAVLVRTQFRATAADVWIRPPRELLAFIRRWRVRGGPQ